jgi:hypothetical protein
MAAVSLDRYVKVYDCRNQKNLFQAYLKNRLNCTLLLGNVGGEESNDDDDDSYDSANDSDGGDVIEDFVDSDSDDDDDDEDGDDDEDERISYTDIEPSSRKQKFSGSKGSGNKKQKKR